uniref:Uncharacterized protein n=1 Tax=Arundo donax TaxID=35708 RepID=A0A0A9A8H5_ARUDO
MVSISRCNHQLGVMDGCSSRTDGPRWRRHHTMVDSVGEGLDVVAEEGGPGAEEPGHHPKWRKEGPIDGGQDPLLPPPPAHRHRIRCSAPWGGVPARGLASPVQPHLHRHAVPH